MLQDKYCNINHWNCTYEVCDIGWFLFSKHSISFSLFYMKTSLCRCYWLNWTLLLFFFFLSNMHSNVTLEAPLSPSPPPSPQLTDQSHGSEASVNSSCRSHSVASLNTSLLLCMQGKPPLHLWKLSSEPAVWTGGGASALGPTSNRRRRPVEEADSGAETLWEIQTSPSVNIPILLFLFNQTHLITKNDKINQIWDTDTKWHQSNTFMTDVAVK